ncbi:MAG: hypothetical protein RLZZ70_384 [Candidatus Parcubacteria bacterium]|jgi:8-oxo-dGTP diphosphatase
MSTTKKWTGAGGAIVYKNQLLMMLRDDKPGLRFANKWDFAGGRRNNSDDSPEACFIRETQEEFGITIVPEMICYKQLYPNLSTGVTDSYFFVAEVTKTDIQNIAFGTEGQGWTLFTPAEFFSHPDVIAPLKQRYQDYLDSVPMNSADS